MGGKQELHWNHSRLRSHQAGQRDLPQPGPQEPGPGALGPNLIDEFLKREWLFSVLCLRTVLPPLFYFLLLFQLFLEVVFDLCCVIKYPFEIRLHTMPRMGTRFSAVGTFVAICEP